MAHVLEIKNLTKSFGKLKAVDDLSMTIDPGECVAFIGQNGAGKSTTMRSVAGLSKIDAGTIQIAGCSVAEDPVGARAKLGYVSQDLALYRFLTGEEFLTLVAKIRGLGDKEIQTGIESLLALCDLTDARHRMIREYSGGMARKIAMAGALIGHPELVVLDESFVGLDPESTFKIAGYLKKYAAGGGAILISSHILEMLHGMCSRFFILHHGKKAADVTLAELDEICRSADTPDITSYYLRMTGQTELIRAFGADSGEVSA